MKAHSAPPISCRLFFRLFLLVLLVPGACTPDAVTCFEDLSAGETAAADLEGTWKVVVYEDVRNQTRIVKDSANSLGGLDVMLTFAGDRISGKNTTNEVSGTFSSAGPGKITIHAFGGTEINEPEWGRLFTRAVHQFNAFTVRNQFLTFYYNNGQNTVTLEKQ